ncbi:MAG TPA: TetR/AcrR family transcriptional regulator [Clostridiaceae bacterium]|nr:TetR/AcrR family transcriptional regulator [Clostridiaceae bacterium]
MEKRKVTSRTLQAIDTKNRIYEAGIGLFYTHGVDSVTITDICNAAGVSVGSFYKYFNTKMDILALNYEDADEFFLEHVKPSITGDTAKERIISYFDHYLEFVQTKPMDFIRNLYRPDNVLFIKKGRAMQTVLSEVIVEGMDNGSLSRVMTAEEANEYLFVSIRGLIFHWCLYDGTFDLRERARTYLNLLLAGF